jgi:hypothetical protein
MAQAKAEILTLVSLLFCVRLLTDHSGLHDGGRLLVPSS